MFAVYVDVLDEPEQSVHTFQKMPAIDAFIRVIFSRPDVLQVAVTETVAGKYHAERVVGTRVNPLYL